MGMIVAMLIIGPLKFERVVFNANMQPTMCRAHVC
jgi:hypothetical protein